MNSQKIKIRLKSFDHKLLDHAASDIVGTIKRTGAEVSGPVPLPRSIKKFTYRGKDIDALLGLTNE